METLQAVTINGQETALEEAAVQQLTEHLATAQVKATYDPDNVFHVNQNVAPAENGQAPA